MYPGSTGYVFVCLMCFKVEEEVIVSIARLFLANVLIFSKFERERER